MKNILIIAALTLGFVFAWKKGILPSLRNKQTLESFRIPVDQAIVNNLQSVINR